MKDNEIITFYDLYARMARETLDILKDPDKQRAIARAQGIDALRDMLEIDPDFLYKNSDDSGMQFILGQLKRCKPYILSEPVVQMLLDMSEKAGSQPIAFEPFLRLPLWIEFENSAVGDNTTSFVACFVYPDIAARSDKVRCDLLTPDMQQTKTVLFSPVGAWEYEQMGACESTTCEIARYTREGDIFRLRESDDCGPECLCQRAGYTWAQLIKGCNHLLKHRKEPLAESLIEREISTPHAGQRLTRKEKEENSAARKRSQPNIIKISLSAPVRVSQRSSGAAHGEQSEIEMKKIVIEAHWRLLIPGEGKPWKRLQILQIESYERHQKPGAPTIYHVEP